MEDLKKAIAVKSEWVADSLAPREVVRGFAFFYLMNLIVVDHFK